MVLYKEIGAPDSRTREGNLRDELARRPGRAQKEKSALHIDKLCQRTGTSRKRSQWLKMEQFEQ
jgi:hypothetical protein